MSRKTIQIAPFSYAAIGTPDGYACVRCSASGVRLYREYNTFLDHQVLWCRACVVAETGGAHYGGDPRYSSPKEHQLGQSRTLVAAVPTEDGETFWGFSSVPQAGVDWWDRLPKTAPGATP